jgi:hypothetical protein
VPGLSAGKQADSADTPSVAEPPPAASAPAVDAAPSIASAPASAADTTKPFAFDAPESAATTTVCGFPGLRLPPGTRVFAAGAYAGRKLGFHIDRSGNQATRIDVAVNQPDAPVVLMLGAYDPTVWNVGWSPGTRIVAVLVGGYHRQAITGLPANVPTLVSTYDNKGPCGFFYVTAERAGQLNPIARRAFGQAVHMVWPARDGKVVIGASLRPGVALVTDRAAADVASFRVADAQQGGPAGLAYAVRQGWLREATRADADAWLAAQAARPQADEPPIAGGRPPGLIDLFNAYVVLRPFTLPAGLYGAHSATFFVPKGVPRPEGELGHSVLFDFNTLTCSGVRCNLH